MQTRANNSDFVGHFARCILILCKDNASKTQYKINNDFFIFIVETQPILSTDCNFERLISRLYVTIVRYKIIRYNPVGGIIVSACLTLPMGLLFFLLIYCRIMNALIFPIIRANNPSVSLA